MAKKKRKAPEKKKKRERKKRGVVEKKEGWEEEKSGMVKTANCQEDALGCEASPGMSCVSAANSVAVDSRPG